ncbi:MAG: IS110 family transposase [Candidatus Cybelea sp.]
MDHVAGVDTHKDTHVIVIIDGVGKLVRALSVPATSSGYRRAISVASELGGTLAWGLESTGCYGASFARKLTDAGFDVFEVPGSFTKRHRLRSSRTGKSDTLDAQAIAEAVLRERDRLPRYTYSAQREGIRLRFEQRDRLVRHRTEAINRLRSAALQLDLCDLPREIGSEVGLATTEKLFDKVPAVDIAAEALQDDAKFAIEDIRRINQRIKKIERLLRPLMRRVVPDLLELRGVSTVVAAALFGHAGDMRNCRDADAFAMRAGTAPVSCSSGKHWAVRVNTGGNRQLNRMLHVIALVQARSENHAGRIYYDRKRAEGKTHQAALRALKRKLSVVVFYKLIVAQAAISDPRVDTEAA